MHNRRNKPLVRPAVSKKRSFRVSKELVFFVGFLLIIVAVLFRPAGAETQSTTVPDKQVKAATVSVKKSQTPFPSLDTTSFTIAQKRLLEIITQEYLLQPESYDDNVMKYTEGFEESWCADFISWVRMEAGRPYISEDTDYWRIPGVVSLKDYYAASDAYVMVGSYTPKFGDVAFYFGETPDGKSREHVALVLDVKNDTLVTIGGNETDRGILQIRTNDLREGERGLTAFGRSTL